MLELLREGLDSARDQLLVGEEPVDAELQLPDDLSAEDRRRLLERLRTDPTLPDDFYQLHLGDPPIKADVRTHQRIAAAIHAALPHALVVGEEATTDEWDAALQSREGSIIFVVDAIDGSRPYEDLTFGYGVTALVYRRLAEGDRLLMTGVANSSGFVAIYDRDGSEVRGGDITRIRPLSQPLRSDFHENTVAVLGAKPGHRSLVGPLLEDDTLTTFTTGGAPAALGLVLGRLTALIAPEAQTTWDAAFLPMLAFLGVTVIVPRPIGDPVVIELAQVLQWFGEVRRFERDDSRPIPPFVVAREPIFAGQLSRTVFPIVDEPQQEPKSSGGA